MGWSSILEARLSANPRCDSVGDPELEELEDYYNVGDDDGMDEFPEIEPLNDPHLEQIRRIEELERNHGHLSSRDLRQRAVQMAMDIMEIRARRGREEFTTVPDPEFRTGLGFCDLAHSAHYRISPHPRETCQPEIESCSY